MIVTYSKTVTMSCDMRTSRFSLLSPVTRLDAPGAEIANPACWSHFVLTQARETLFPARAGVSRSGWGYPFRQTCLTRCGKRSNTHKRSIAVPAVFRHWLIPGILAVSRNSDFFTCLIDPLGYLIKLANAVTTHTMRGGKVQCRGRSSIRGS